MKWLPGILLLFIAPASTSAKEWQTLTGCRLVTGSHYDGDSFYVAHEGREFIFRLYFVDTPETDLAYPERVAEQAEHFGISKERTPAAGRQPPEPLALYSKSRSPS